jgi:kynurenine formamidase
MSKKFKNHMSYIGKDLGYKDEAFHFPGWGESAAKLMIEREVNGLGIDAASIDCGNSEDLPTHTIFLRTDRYMIENLILDDLPPKGFTFITMPLKVKGGPESEARVMAIVPE